MRNSTDLDISNNGCIQQLKIKEAYPKSAGNYLCKGENIGGEALTTSTVYFQAKTPPYSDSETSEEAQKPAFYVPLSNIEAEEMTDITLECSIVGVPEPTVMWFHDDNLLKESNTIKIISEGETCKLILRKSKLDQAGTYSIKAKNIHGESKSSCILKIKPQKQISDSQTQTSDCVSYSKKVNSYSYSATEESMTKRIILMESDIAQKQSEPKFVNPIKGKFIDEGSSLILEGTFIGTPQPRITWSINGKQVHTDGNIKITNMKNKSILTIKNVNSSLSGNYICKAENEAGMAESIADVVVKKKQLSPVFLNRLQSKYHELGQRLIMEVEIGGKPSPEVFWYLNEREIKSGGDLQIRRHGNHATLIIESLKVFMLKIILYI